VATVAYLVLEAQSADAWRLECRRNWIRIATEGNAVYYFHYPRLEIQPGHNGSPGTFSFFSANKALQPQQPLAQFLASQLINLEWLQPGSVQSSVVPQLRTRRPLGIA
jgi:hypothetical protein